MIIRERILMRVKNGQKMAEQIASAIFIFISSKILF